MGFPAPIAPATLREGDTSPPSTPSGSQPCPRGTGPIVSSLLPPPHLSRHASRTSGFPPEPVAWPPALLAQLPAPGPQGCRPCPATHPRPQPSQPWGPGQSTLCPACSQHASHPQASASFLLRGPSEQAGPGREAVKLSPGCLPPPQSTACCPTQSWQAVHAHVCVHVCACRHTCVCAHVLWGVRGPQLSDQGPPARPSETAAFTKALAWGGRRGGAAPRGAPPVRPRAVPSPKRPSALLPPTPPPRGTKPFLCGACWGPPGGQSQGEPTPPQLPQGSIPTHTPAGQVPTEPSLAKPPGGHPPQPSLVPSGSLCQGHLL